ncbi:TPA: hypothetical protein HA317_00260 [Candidatus Woesearchaeota archaeon]|nr:hypothetical protein [Candidatus Woesearchaeota archaeon]
MKRGQITAILLVLTLAIAALSFTGCTSGETTTPGSPFVGGTNGILMSFLEGNPPAEVTDDKTYPFNVVVKVKNDGEANIRSSTLKITLSGFDPKEFGFSDGGAEAITNTLKEELTATRKDVEGNTIEGSTVYMTFPPEDSGLPPFEYTGKLSGNTPFTIRADACYLYGTQANAKLCLKRNVLEPDKKGGVCKVTESKTVYNSGGPVQVTSLKESVGGQGKVSITFTLEHKGNGKIYLAESTGYRVPGDSPLCGKDEKGRESVLKKDMIGVVIETGMEGLTCTGISPVPSGNVYLDDHRVVDLTGEMFTRAVESDSNQYELGYIKLYDGKRTVTCMQSVADIGSSTAEKVLNIYLIYNYKEDISQQILVKHAGGYEDEPSSGDSFYPAKHVSGPYT